MPVTNAERSLSFRWQLGFFLLASLLIAMPVQASRVVESVPVAQITFDDEGSPLDFPSAVFFDPERDELYVVNAGTGRIVVYGPDYFPRWSIGSGRGVVTPGGGTVLSDGRVLAIQQRNRYNPTAKITLLNGAFFPEHDIPLENLPGIEDFAPRKVAISDDGLMYVAGDNYRGVLVLDDEGYFLRKLQPTDQVDALSKDYVPEEEATEDEETVVSEAAEEEDVLSNIPEEFRPRTNRVSRGSNRSESTSEGPVKINYVTIGGDGRIYMLSAETGKIYVHDSEERFLFSFGTKGGSPGQMSNPRSLVIDEERDLIYVADYMRHTILAYDLAGEQLFETGGRGFSPGWFNFPNDIAINSRGEIIVADLYNRRIQILEVIYDESFYNLDYLLDADEATSDSEGAQRPLEDAAGDEVETFDLVPGAPDIDYANETEDLLLVEGAEEGEEASDDSETEEPIVIEILQDPEIPVITE